MASTIKPALNQRPETLDRVHMVDTSGIFTLAMMYHAMRISELLNGVVTGKLIGMNGVLGGSGNVIPDYRHDGTSFNVFDNRGKNLPFIPVSQTDNRRLATTTTPCTLTRPLTADICLINFDVTVHGSGFFGYSAKSEERVNEQTK